MLVNLPFRDRPNRPLRVTPRDRKVTFLIALAGVTIIMLVISTPAAVSASHNAKQIKVGTDAIQSGTDLQGCRSYFSSFVTDATTKLNKTRTQNDIVENTFLSAIASDNKGSIPGLVHSLDMVRAQLEIDSDALDKANDRYQASVILAIKDPVKFLAKCPKAD